MKVFKYNKLLVVFILIGLIAALFIDVQRNGVEKQNTSVDLAIDYEGLVELAEREGLPPIKSVELSKQIQAHGYRKIKRNKGVVFQGLGLASPIEEVA